MLEFIKSTFILKNIFSFIHEKTKLIILNHNKRYQNKLNIKINDYKRFCHKYIIFKWNNKGEERDSYDESLIFIGEYLNGKRNGYGKEYAHYRLIFEGAYLNGKRNGYGKEYYEYGQIKYEGIYLNGKKWNGTGYNACNDILYKIKDGNGLSKEYHYNGQKKFEGEYKNGLKHGKAKTYNRYGKLEFEGEYLFGQKWNGKKIKCNEFNDIIFIRKYNNGKVKEYNRYGKLIFEGRYLNGKKIKKGKVYNWNGKLIFEGEYLDNYRLKGREYYNDKLLFEGEYKKGIKYNGKGYDEKNNIIYEIQNGKGTVKEYDDHGHLFYEGDYLNGKRNGKGKTYFNNGNLFL